MSGLNVESFAGATLERAMLQENQQKMAKLGANARSRNVDPNAAAKKAREVASEFESVFLSQMLQPMFAPLETAPPFGGGQAEKMWRGLMIDEYGKAMTRQGGIGIADAVYAQIIKMQEAQ